MSDGKEMKVYIHDDRSEPCFMIPIADGLWLVWIKRDSGPSEWSIKNIEYIKSMRQKYPAPMTTFDVAEKSEMLVPASGLDLVLHTGQSLEEVRDIYREHKKALEETEAESKLSGN